MSNNILERLMEISPEKQELLALFLEEEGVELQREVIVPQSREKNKFPLSYAQERLWFLNQLEPNNPAYNIPLAVRVNGRFNLSILKQTIHEIVYRHAILRTTFITENNQPVQTISAEIELPLSMIDMCGLPDTVIQQQIAKESQRLFNLSKGPLFHISVIQCSAEEHIIMLTMHHIISDGWSMSILLQEIGTLYNTFNAGQPSPLPNLPIQYADFSQWQRQWMQEEALDTQLAYWKENLANCPPVLELPSDRPHPAIPTNQGAHYLFSLSQEITQSLNDLSREKDTTLFMTLLSIFQTLLYRYTNQADICIGTPVANRNRSEIENLIGFFVNTLVIRTKFADNITFSQLLEQVKETTVNAFSNQDLPFEMIVDTLHIGRNLSHTPLFQVMFSLGNTPAMNLNLPGITLTPLETDTYAATFDLTLAMNETEEGLHGSLEYNTDLFNADTIERLFSHFQMLLAAVITNPDTALSNLPLLTHKERQQLALWNDTDVPIPDNRCIHHLIANQSLQTPSAIVLVHDEEQWTYQQLNQHANQLAHHLIRLGVQPDDLVGVIVDRSPQMIVALLGILKAGAAYLPLDPNYPTERLAHMITDAQPAVVLQTLDHHPLTADYLTVDLTNWEVISQERDDNPETAVSQNNLAYVIYTSGSTGKPKGVMITHRGLINHNLAVIDLFGITAVDRAWQFATINFDTAVEEIFPTLISGATLILRSPYIPPTAKLCQIIEENQLTILNLPTAYWHAWAHDLVQSGANLPSCLRLVVVGGEKVTAEGLRLWQKAVKGTSISWLNSYGPTETTIIVTAYAPNGNTMTTVPIGKPIANTKAYVLDKNKQLVPIGIPGELHIGGHNLARGYLNQPELTAERFIQLSIPNKQSPSTVYRTGDLVRFLPDGNLEFLGRVDHQVKIRGFRIELGEIEGELNRHPQIQESITSVWEDPELSGSKQIIAYYTCKQEQAPGTSDLRHFLAETLPEYMIPAAFIALDEMPLTNSGKIDRRNLPAPDNLRPDLAVEFVLPRTPIEETLASLWQQVLSKDQVGIHDNFFDLGGHSLLATQLISRIQDSFDIDLPLRHIFESPTIADLAQHVEIAQRAERKLQAPPIVPVSREGELPLSFAQQRLWFLDQLEPNSPFYNIPESVRLTGDLDVDVLERCLQEVVQRHEALRTTIIMTEDGRPFQNILPQLTIPLPLIDLQGLPLADREAEARRLVQADTQRPFTLNTGPLLRATLIRLAPDDHIILFTLHHIISDNWSSNILTQEIGVLYEAFSNGRFSPLPELPLQYADFAHWQRHWLQGEVLASQLDFWRHTFADSPTLLDLPTDRPRPPVQTFNGNYLPFTFSETLSAAVETLCRETNTTPFMLLLAAYQTLLFRYSGQAQINVGTPIANRNRADIENMIGFFVNTLVVPGDLTGNPTFRQLLQRTRETSLGAFAHQDVPFEMIVDALNVARNLSHSPLFQVMFVIQSGQMPQDQVVKLPQLTLTPVDAHSGTAKFDLTLFMLEDDGLLAGAWEYNTDLFDPSTIERMMLHFETLLTSIVADPDQSLETLPLLTPAERQQLLVAWNRTTAVVPHTLCVHQLFEAQVARTPDATAVTGGAHSLSYADLNQRANQVAHHLRSLGIGPEKRVAIAAERSPDMVVGLLGILKAGGAYVPLDPTYPPDRLAYMLADSAAPILLTQHHLLSAGSLAQTERDSAQLTICLDEDWESISQNRSDNPDNLTQPDNLAYVIYTSGSTGRPKGTMLLHRGLVNYLSWCLQAYSVAAGDGAPVHSSISFDLTITGLFAPLLAGRTVHLLPEDIGVDLLSNALQEAGDYSLVKITPAHLELLTQQISPMKMAGRTRSFVIGGENLLADSLIPWQQNAPETVLINEYGPTETVVGCCVYQVPPGEKRAGSVPIGRPIINTQLYILDTQLQPVPIGVPGELYIGGVQVARGYLNRPELTAERFIQLPAYPELETASENGHLGERTVYKTGDLCRYLPDGNIEFLGRLDHQVKMHGFRIELGEIEAELSQLPALQKVAVIDREDEPGQKRLVAYLVAEGVEQLAAPDLRQRLQHRLPDYMIPAAFVYLDEMPLTSNGKVDRRALPAPEFSREDMATRYAAPETENEQVLAAIWAQLLHREEVGIHDSFFELGGDSILSIQVVARANQAGLRLTPRQVFQHPTIAELAAVAGTGPVILAEQGLVVGEVPLTPIQHWFLSQDQPHPHHWNQAVLLQIERPLSANILEQTITHLLDHHDALRMRYTHENGRFQQYNLDHITDNGVTWVDLSDMHPQAQAETITQQAAQFQASLNLTAGPLLRVVYFDLGAEQAGRLLLITHHLVIDGVSWRILLEDLGMVYEQLSQGIQVQLPHKTTSFKAWAGRLTSYAQTEEALVELDNWLAMRGGEKRPLPRDIPDGINNEASAKNITITLPSSETEALMREVPAKYRTEINDILLTALIQTICNWSGSTSLLVDLESHGRADLFADMDITRTVGWFTAIYPVMLTLHNATDSGSQIKSVKEQLRQISDYGIHYSILRYLHANKSVTAQLASQIQAEISFNYLGQFDQILPKNAPYAPAPESSGSDRSENGRRPYLLDINGGITKGQLHLTWTYSSNIHRAETINHIAQQYLNTLRQLIAHCQTTKTNEATPSDFPLANLNQKKLDKLMAQMNKAGVIK